MKFNVEVELDWIGEDSSIDDAVKDQILTNIENKVLSSLQKKVLDSAQERIEAQIATMVDTSVNAMITEKIAHLMTVPRTSTDDYGRVKRENFTIEQALIDAVENAVTKATLDESGREANTYNAKYSRFDWFAKKDIPALVEARVKTLSEQVKKDIEALVSEKIKTQVADKLTALIVDNSTALSLRGG